MDILELLSHIRELLFTLLVVLNVPKAYLNTSCEQFPVEIMIFFLSRYFLHVTELTDIAS